MRGDYKLINIKGEEKDKNLLKILTKANRYINTRYIYESIKYSIFGGIESYLWFFPALIFSTIFISFFIKKNRFKELI